MQRVSSCSGNKPNDIEKEVGGLFTSWVKEMVQMFIATFKYGQWANFSSFPIH